jgi:hypothetical protein
MRVRLLRSWINTQGKKYPIGQYLDVDRTLGKKLLAERYAVEDNAQYPPKKVKSDLFKPK